MQQLGQPNGRRRDRRRARGADADAVHSEHYRALGARRADGDGRQCARANGAVQTDVYVGGGDSDYVSGADPYDGALRQRPAATCRAADHQPFS